MTTLLLATSGGHLRQLDQLAGRIGLDRDALWVTDADDQSRSLLAGRRTEFVPFVGPRDVGAVLRCVSHADRIRRLHGVRRAISTGSGIALGYLPYLAARGVECHYIESATRVAGPSVTGHVLSRTRGVRRYCQYPHWTRRGWHYAGNVFDDYAAASAAPRTGVLRVVVTVGIATGFPFRRLLDRLVPLLAPDGPLSRATGREVSVVWQTAGTSTAGLPITGRSSIPAVELGELMHAADLVISHAGTGTAVSALDQGRVPVLVPRRVDHGEIGDDHQAQLAGELARRGLAVHRDVEDLSLDDLVAALPVRAQRVAAPPPFALRS